MKPKKPRQASEASRRIPPEELATLLKVSSALATSLDLNAVLQTAIDSAVSVMRLETGAIYLLEGEDLYLGATTPPLLFEQQSLLLTPEPLHDHPLLNQALVLGQPVFVPDARAAKLSAAETAIREARSLKTILYVPLLLEEKAIGVLILGTTSRVCEFSAHDIDLCRTLSYQIALAVANARLFRSVQQSNIELVRSYDATLLGWSMVLEMRDQETQGHTLRVTQLTMELVRRMEIPEPLLAHIYRGALLHDIGKMSIPDTILNKNGPLSTEEWAIMQKHPEYAYQFLRQIDYLSPALDIPYCHHEKWDGSGYPRGLKGDEIPLPARIFAVADVFDALISNRSYRAAWRKEDALRYIREQEGKHFDPCVVKVFLNGVVGE